MSEFVEEIHPPRPTHKWVDEDVPGVGRVASFWAEIRTAASIVDTLETARTIARELLRNHAPSWSAAE